MQLNPVSVRTGAAIVAAAALLAASNLLGSTEPAEGAPTGTLTFKELERGATFTHIRNTTEKLQRSNLRGDLIAFTAPLADLSGKRIGTLHASCITTTGARNFAKSTATCTGAIALRDGTLTVQFVLRPRGNTTSGSVTGGTGAYANAGGVFVSRGTRRGVTDTVTFGG